MENSQLFVTVDRLVAGYKRAFLVAVALNVLMGVLVVYMGLRVKDRDVVYVSEAGVEHRISEQQQVKLHSEWLVRSLFEVDAYSIVRKQEQAKALGEVELILKQLKEGNITSDVVRYKQAFSVSMDSLIVTNETFPYRVGGTFQRVDSKTLSVVRFSYSATVLKTAVSIKNPLGLSARDVVINLIK